MPSRPSLATAILILSAVQAQAKETMDLSSRVSPGMARGVTVHLKLGGDLLALPQNQNSTNATGEPTESQPTLIDVVADIAYDEAILPPNANSQRSARFYKKVDATVNVGGNQTKPTLRDGRRLVVAQINKLGKRLEAVDGPLTRNEFETLDFSADSLALDALLPEEPVAIGDTWTHDEAVMMAFTGLESLDVCEVSSILIEANDRYARCKMTGAVHGVSHGARVELDIDANYLVDCEAGYITKFLVAVRDERTIGPARPGLSGVVQLRYESTPLERSRLLPESMLERAAELDRTDSPIVETRSGALGFAVAHDLAWYGAGTRRDLMTLRRVEGERLVAHGTIARLAAKRLDPERALAVFRSDTVRTIGDAMTNLLSEEQWTNQQGCRVMGVVAEGEVSGVPIEWHTYLVAPPEDSQATHRLALTFTVEKSQLSQLENRDRKLVDQIELIPMASGRETAGRSQIGEKLVH